MFDAVVALLWLLNGVAPDPQAGRRVYICADMEGVSTVISIWDVAGADGGRGTEGKDYERNRSLLTAEVNAAIRGAREAGATEFLVKECHGARGFRNLVVEELDPDAKLLRGLTIPGTMWAGLERGFDAVFLVAAHARWGSASVIAHNFLFTEFRINDRPMSEGAFVALMAGQRGVPVVLITGDNVAVDQLRATLGDVEGAAVKESLSNQSALMLHPARAQQLIRDRARSAIERLARFKPFVMPGPYRLEFGISAESALAKQIPALLEHHRGLERRGEWRFAITTDSLDDIARLIDDTAVLAGLGAPVPAQEPVK